MTELNKKSRFLISLKFFNIIVFFIGLIVIISLAYKQFVDSKKVIKRCFISKKELATSHVQTNLFHTFAANVSLLLQEEKNFLKDKVFEKKDFVLNKNFKIVSLSNDKYIPLLKVILKDKKLQEEILKKKIYLSSIYFSPQNLSFVRFYFIYLKDKIVVNYLDKSIKKDLREVVELSSNYVSSLDIYYKLDHLISILNYKVPNVSQDILKELYKFKRVRIFEWDKNRLLIYSSFNFVNNFFIIKTEYSLNELKMVLHDLFKNLFLNAIVVVVGFLLFYVFIIKNISNVLIRLSNNMKYHRKCTKCNTKIKELYDLAYYYNILYDQLNEEIKHNKALLELNKRFVVDTIHQIRTPIGVIMLNLDLLKMMVKDKEVEDIIEEIDAAVSMLSNSYEDLAYISSNDTLDYKPALINISELTQERVEFFRKIAKVSGKNIIGNIEDGIEYFINKIEYERIVDNNISNAIKYSTGEDIFVNLFRRDDNIILEIASYGAPIKNKKEIFEVNYREQLHKRGLGIGLNIVKTICEKYNIKYRVYYRNRQNIFEYVFPPIEVKGGVNDYFV